MAEWFKRSTVNTFYRGSSPLKAYVFKYFISYILYKIKRIIISEHVEIGKQSSLKKKWK
jgi:hypothetical protein